MKILKKLVNGWFISSLCCLSVAPVAAEWNFPAITISAPGSSKPQMKMDPNGNAVLTWLECHGTHLHLREARLLQNLTWSETKSNSSFAGDFSDHGAKLLAVDFLPSNYALNAKFAVDSKGHSVAVWEEDINGEVSIIGARLPFKSNLWIPIEPLSAPGGNSPQVAMNTAGDAFVVWVSESGVVKTATLLSDSHSWSFPSINISALDEKASDPQIAVDSIGNVVAVWRKTISDEHIIIQSAQFSSSGTWSEPVDLSDEGEKAGIPQLSMDHSGNIILAVWANEALGLIRALSTRPIPPIVKKVSPNYGLPDGGNFVVITGTDFTNATNVLFGGTNARGFEVNSATEITAVAPAGTSNTTVDITVTTPQGTSATTAADQYTYKAPAAPTVTGVSPNFGLAGTHVTIRGTNFVDVTAVNFGCMSATVVEKSPTQITAVAPAGLNCSTVDITVVTCDQTSAISPADQYTYKLAAPTVKKVSPNFGLEGTSVTITGTNFAGVTAVNFGDTPATSFTEDTLSSITAISPPGFGVVDVTVTSCTDRTSPITSADHYTYLLPLPVTSSDTYQNVAPLPPSKFTGSIKIKRHSDKRKCGLKASWEESPSSDVVAYKIYRKCRVIATIPAEYPLHFEKIISKKRIKGYSITAVNKNKQESSHVKLKL